MQRAQIQTISQGPAQNPLDPDIDRQTQQTPSEVQYFLEPVLNLTQNRGKSIEPMAQIPESLPTPVRR